MHDIDNPITVIQLAAAGRGCKLSKFTIIREEDAPTSTKRIYKEILKVKHLRYVPNFFKTLANSPAILEGTWTAYRNVSTRGGYPRCLRK
jgi:hypothetical protein